MLLLVQIPLVVYMLLLVFLDIPLYFSFGFFPISTSLSLSLSIAFPSPLVFYITSSFFSSFSIHVLLFVFIQCIFSIFQTKTLTQCGCSEWRTAKEKTESKTYAWQISVIFFFFFFCIFIFDSVFTLNRMHYDHCFISSI